MLWSVEVADSHTRVWRQVEPGFRTSLWAPAAVFFSLATPTTTTASRSLRGGQTPTRVQEGFLEDVILAPKRICLCPLPLPALGVEASWCIQHAASATSRGPGNRACRGGDSVDRGPGRGAAASLGR
eukprot:118578-Chlamydomonas_euryale.AAC.6